VIAPAEPPMSGAVESVRNRIVKLRNATASPECIIDMLESLVKIPRELIAPGFCKHGLAG
jgi:hypothetical protein